MKSCFNCGSYNPYYIKGKGKFERQDIGFCSRHNTVLAKFEECGEWRYNSVRKKIEKKLLLKSLDKALFDLSQISQILSQNEQEQS